MKKKVENIFVHDPIFRDFPLGKRIEIWLILQGRTNRSLVEEELYNSLTKSLAAQASILFYTTK